MLNQVGRELRVIRMRKGLTLKQASKITGVHYNTLSEYENYPEKMKLGKLFELLEKYEVDETIFFENLCEYIR